MDVRGEDHGLGLIGGDHKLGKDSALVEAREDAWGEENVDDAQGLGLR